MEGSVHTPSLEVVIWKEMLRIYDTHTLSFHPWHQRSSTCLSTPRANRCSHVGDRTVRTRYNMVGVPRVSSMETTIQQAPTSTFPRQELRAAEGRLIGVTQTKVSTYTSVRVAGFGSKRTPLAQRLSDEEATKVTFHSTGEVW